MRHFVIFIMVCIVFLESACVGQREATSRKEKRIEARRQKKCEQAAYKWGCDFTFPVDTIIQEKTVTVIKDTTITIKVPGEMRIDSFPVPANMTLSKKVVQTKYARAEAWVDNGQLRLKLIQDDIEVEKTIQAAIKTFASSQQSTAVSVVTKPYPVVTNHLNKWQRIFYTIGLISAALVLIRLILFLYRKNYIPGLKKIT